MNIKSSDMFRLCLQGIQLGEYQYVCAALVGCEYDLRQLHNENIVCKASKVWLHYKPAHVKDAVKNTQQWWPLHSPERIDALRRAIADCQIKGD